VCSRLTDRPPAPSPDPTPAPKVLDFKVAVDHANKVKADMIAVFAGKKEMNPFLYASIHIDPLIRQVANGDKTPETHGKLMALKVVEPKV
jgi:hypothetical protein